MRRKRKISRRENQQGVIITLVAVFMLFVIGAMAALSIDVVTLYTARSEAQLAADAAALAGARVLANSGLTSTAAGPAAAEDLARTVAKQAAANNLVGGRNLVAGTAQCTTGQEICVSFNDGSSSFATDPHVTVTVQRTDLPTFFARIWGRMQVAVGASATAEAYNPSGASALGGATTPVAPICVKPWLLPNIDPTNAANPIFDRATGAISNAALLGWMPAGVATELHQRCTNCSVPPLPAPTAWRYYPGNPVSFPSPTQSLPTCTPALTTPYEESVAGCVQTPIACNDTLVQIDNADYGARETETADAVNCLAHATTGGGDTVTPLPSPTPPTTPFEFVAGADNPIPGASGNDVMVSDSLVTVPVYDVGPPGPPPYPSPPEPPGTVTIVGFLQLFLSPNGAATANTGPDDGRVNTMIINMAGCGTSAAGNPILGNGASPVAVRLISPP
ncbi:MAG: pilus assembly protein TadG-related protein [Terriglobales bacterium]